MITGALLSFFHGLAVSVFSWLSTHLPAAPTFWTSLTGALNTALGVVPSSIRYFVPLAPVVVAGAALISLIVVLGGLKLARRVLSLFTGGGGMA